LTWSSQLAASAQAWANHLAAINDLQHDPNAGAAGQGENLYSGFNSAGGITLVSAVTDWVNEQANYHGEKIGDGNFEAYGHYTQIIWPETTQVGMAAATASNGSVYIVGRYSPPGNVPGQSPYRPGPPSSSGTGQGGFYLVNSFRNGQASSGIAWYTNLGPENVGQQPDKYVDIKTDGNVIWEGSTHSGMLLQPFYVLQFTYVVSGKLPDGTVVTAAIEDSAAVQAAQTFAQVGSATVGVTGHGVYKAIQEVLYEIDGWKVYAVYYG